MCGRISLFAELGDLAEQFQFTPGDMEGAYAPSWNIPPTAPVLAVQSREEENLASVMRWGFTFSRRDSNGGSMRPLFNAHSETITERPPFRAAFAEHRCLVPINGFYRWRSNNGSRTPLWIHRADEAPFTLAGIYNRGHEAAAVCVITCELNYLMTTIHNRIPAMLTDNECNAWLDPQTETKLLRNLLEPKGMA